MKRGVFEAVVRKPFSPFFPVERKYDARLKMFASGIFLLPRKVCVGGRRRRRRRRSSLKEVK